MAEEEKEVEVKESPEDRQENSKHRRRSRSPINPPNRRGRGGRGRAGRRQGGGGYRGWDRSADDIDNKTNSEEPHLKRARLFVGNIATESVTRRDLAQLFGQYGRVLGVSVHGGFAFVQMDRERDANRAIICEDGQQFKGTKIHVEFSQAAKDAGARRAQLQSRSPPPPPRERERDYGPPPPLPRLDEHRVSHEERLERLLLMEREMAYMQAREDVFNEVITRNQLDPPPMTSYDHHRRDDGYRRPQLSPPPPSNQYPRDREYPVDRGNRSGPLDDRRPYYSRSDGPGMALQPSGPDSRSDQLLSYPPPRNRTGNGHRGAADLLAGAYGGAATSGKSVGYGSSGYSKSPASGGYSLGKASSSWGSPHDYPRGGGSAGRSGAYTGSAGGGYWN